MSQLFTDPDDMKQVTFNANLSGQPNPDSDKKDTVIGVDFAFPDSLSQAKAQTEIDYLGKKIKVEYFDTDTELMGGLEKDAVKPKYQSIAYCDTFTEEENPTYWGKIYLLKELDIDCIAHECTHLASGILARKYGDTAFKLTAGDATDLEEEFCGIVGEVTELLASAKLQRLMVGEQVALLDRLIKRARLLKLYTSVAMLQDEKYKLKALSHIQEPK